MTTPTNDPNKPTMPQQSAPNERKQVASYRAMRRLLKRVSALAMRQADAAAAANEALVILRSELVSSFDLLRSRQRQPTLIVPEPLSPAMSNASNHAINLSQ